MAGRDVEGIQASQEGIQDQLKTLEGFLREAFHMFSIVSQEQVFLVLARDGCIPFEVVVLGTDLHRLHNDECAIEH